MAEQGKSLSKLEADINKRLGIVEDVRDQTIRAQDTTTKNILQINKTARNARVSENTNRAAFETDTEEALTNLETYANWQPSIRRVMAWFDPDFSAEGQRARLAKAQFGLDRLDKRQAAIETRRQSLLSDESIKSAAQQNTYKFTRDGFLDTNTGIALGFQIEANVRKNLVQRVMDADSADIKRWIADPGSAPKELKNVPGLLQAEDIRRRANEVNVNVTEANLEAFTEKKALNSYIESLDGVEGLGKVLTNPKLIPPEFKDKIGVLRNEFNRQEGIMLDIESASALLTDRKTNLFLAAKKRALIKMSSQDVQGLLQSDPSATSYEVAPGVSFTRNELLGQMASATELEKKRNTTLIENSLSKVEALGAKDEYNAELNSLLRLISPGNPNPGLDNLSETTQARVTDVARKGQVLQQLEAINFPGTSDIQTANFKSGSKDIKQRIEDIIEKQTPSGDKEHVRENLANNGETYNASASMAYMLNNASNPEVLSYDPVLGPAFRNLATELLPLLTGKAITQKKDGSYEFNLALAGGSGETPNAVLQEAISASKFKTIYRDVAIQDVLRVVTMDLLDRTQQGEQDFDDPTAITQQMQLTAGVNQLINSRTGTLPPSYFAFNEETGQQVFDFNKFLEETAGITVELQQQGILEVNETIADILIDDAMQMINDGYLDNKFRQHPMASALKQLILGNNAQELVISELRAVQRDAPAVYNRIRLAEQQRKRSDRLLIEAVNKSAKGGNSSDQILTLP